MGDVGWQRGRLRGVSSHAKPTSDGEGKRAAVDWDEKVAFVGISLSQLRDVAGHLRLREHFGQRLVQTNERMVDGAAASSWNDHGVSNLAIARRPTWVTKHVGI